MTRQNIPNRPVKPSTYPRDHDFAAEQEALISAEKAKNAALDQKFVDDHYRAEFERMWAKISPAERRRWRDAIATAESFDAGNRPQKAHG